MNVPSFGETKALAALCISLFVINVGFGIIGPFMPIYAESLGATGILLGLIFSAFSLSQALFMPLTGRLSDALRRRKIFLITGLSIYGASSLGYVLSDTLYKLITVRFLHGIGSALVQPISMAYAGDIAPKGKEGSHMGTVNTATLLGMACGPFMGGLLMDHYGTASPFLAMWGLAMASLVLTMLTLPEQEIGLSHHREVSFRRVLQNRAVRGIVIYRAVNAVSTGALSSFLPLIAASIGSTPSEIGLLNSMAILLISLLQRPLGTLADKYPKTKLIIVSGLATSLLMAFMPSSRTFLELLTVACVMGVFWAVLMPTMGALTAEFGREYGMASVMGLFSFAWSLGMIAGPLISGIFMSAFGLASIFYFGSAVGIIGISLFYVLAKSK